MSLLRGSLLKASVLGAVDGVTVVLGVLFSLAGHPDLVVPTAISVAVAEAVGMAAGEWLSDSSNGFGGAIAIGIAVLLGSIIPALPWLWLRGTPAIVASIVVLLALAAVITVLRGGRGPRRAAIETFGVLGITTAALFLLQHF